MNWNFFSHILRDVFPKFQTPLIYGSDITCIDTFRSQDHSLGFHLLYTGKALVKPKKYIFDESLANRQCFWGLEYCDLFVALEQDANIKLKSDIEYLISIMKSGGFVFLLGDHSWGEDLDNTFILRKDLVDEVKRYTMFKDEEVFVYEKV